MASPLHDPTVTALLGTAAGGVVSYLVRVRLADKANQQACARDQDRLAREEFERKRQRALQTVSAALEARLAGSSADGGKQLVAEVACEDLVQGGGVRVKSAFDAAALPIADVIAALGQYRFEDWQQKKPLGGG